MKKIAASIGIIALGTACVQAADESYSSAESGKLWKVSASLRGFYDDNVNNVAKNSANRTSTAGFSVSPGVGLDFQRDSTTILLSYRYTLLYYGVKPFGNTSNYDQNHMFDLALTHLINERYRFKVADSFVLGQEPDTLRSSDALTTTQRIPGDNIRNTASIVFNAELTPLFGLEAGYANTIFDYSAHGAVTTGPVLAPTGVFPSISGSSDRMEHNLHLDGRWQWLPQTTVVLGYQFSMVNFTANELIAVGPTGTQFKSKSRDNRTHTVDAGVEHIFNPDFFVSARAGASFVDYYNDSTSRNDVSPYVRLSANYTYAPESSIQAGFTYDRNSTDTIGSISVINGLTTAQESATVFATLVHRIVPSLFGTLTAQWQDSTFVGGTLDSQTEQYLLLGGNLRYEFIRYLSAEVGYNFDLVDSATGRSYTRNRFYVGVTGTY